MRNARKWLVGLAVLALLFVGVSALANTPKVIRIDGGKLPPCLDSSNKLRVMAQQFPNTKFHKPAAGARAQQLLQQKPSSEAYAWTGAAWSEGFANKTATNGKVTVWMNDTYFGNLTFAPANDIAHPTAYAVGFQGYGPQYTYFPGSAYSSIIANEMQFVGDMFYYNTGYSIEVFDCSDPTSIVYTAEFDLSCYVVASPDWIYDFKVRNGYLWAAIGYSGFLIYDLKNPSFPVMYGNVVHVGENPDLAPIGGAN